MVCPTLIDGKRGRRFFFNLDGNVGLKSPNRIDDVQLVQFGYFAMSKAPTTHPQAKAVYAMVVPGAPYSGAADDPLTIAIQTHQRSRGGALDGHVSPFRAGTGGGRYDGVHVYIAIPLIWNVYDLLVNDWPRIDKHPRCPPALKAAIFAMCED